MTEFNAIEIEGLSKAYRLGTIGHGALYRDLQSLFARIRGKEDPNLKLDANPRGADGMFWALFDLRLQVGAGERLGIIGRNGAGKSTLLKVLSRVTSPTSGRVKLRGRVASLLEVGTGFHPELTGRENIYLNGSILGMTRKEVKARFEQILDFSGVGPFVDTPVKRYSSGMYVRLAFAVAAHLEPDILIVDEVLAVGDLEFQKKCLGKMEEVSKNSGRTVLFVSHNMEAIAKLCQSAALLEGGRLRKHGPAAETIREYVGFDSVAASAEKVQFEDSENFPVAITAAALRDSNGATARRFGWGDEIFLEIEYTCRTEFDGVGICFDLAYRGELLLSQCDTDQLPDPIVTRLPGAYKIRVRLPRFLKPGEYYFSRIFVSRLIKTSRNSLAAMDSKEAQLPFEVLPPLDNNGYRSYLAPQAGLVCSRETWETVSVAR